MKLITFINYAYADIGYNLYLQLKKFNRHKDLIIFCTDDETHVKLSERKPDCKIETYKPLLFKDVFDENKIHLENKAMGATHNKSVSYTIYQFLKQDCFYQTLLENERVCLLDADVIIFEDFVDELIFWMDNPRRFMYESPSDIGLKYYLSIRIGVDFNSPETLHHWIGKENIVNAGFMYARKSESSLKHIKNYCKLFIPHFGYLNNLDEYIMTEYYRNIIDNITSINDQINLVSNTGAIYTSEQVLKIKPMTFHPTFTPDKIQFMKECDQWFVE